MHGSQQIGKIAMPKMPSAHIQDHFVYSDNYFSGLTTIRIPG